MSVPAGPVGAGASRERKAKVYVLAAHINNRPFYPRPLPNAATRDLDLINDIDGLAHYPVVRDNYWNRRNNGEAQDRTNRAWAEAAIDAIYQGKPVPARQGKAVEHTRWEQILTLLIARGPEGATRKEICTHYNLDGGRISAALSAMHSCGVIVLLHTKR